MNYLSVAAIDSAIVNLAAAHPGVAQLITLPDLTAEGRTSHALCLGAGLPGTRDSVLVIGGVHAREWGSCEIALNFATDLLTARHEGAGLRYGAKTFTAAQVGNLLNTLHILVFPMVNPDGRHYSQTIDPMWRKNRRPAPAGAHPDCIGVDINRNFDFLFNFNAAFAAGSGVSASAAPCDGVFQGAQAFSEPESRNVKAMLDQFKRTRWFIDLHSYSECVLHVWGDDDTQSINPRMRFDDPTFDGQRGMSSNAYQEFLPASDLAQLKALSTTLAADLQAVRGIGYTPMSAFEFCPSSGASHDYAYSRHHVNANLSKTLGFVVEWGTEYQPPWVEMERIIKDVSAGLIGFCLAV